MAKITIVVGPPAAGKTSYVKKNQAPGDVVVDFDSLASALGRDSREAESESNTQVSFAARGAAIARVFEGVAVDAWIIASSPSPQSVDRFVAGGADFVVVDPGKETVLRQAAKDNRPPGTADLIEAWYLSPPIIPKDSRKSVMSTTKLAIINMKADVERTESPTGQIVYKGYPSVFNVVDSYGEVVMPGAFADAVKAYDADASPMSVYYAHNMNSDPDLNVGYAKTLTEDGHGLLAEWVFDSADNPKAATAERLVKSGRIREMSFAFQVTDHEIGMKDGNPVVFLKKLDLLEISICPVGVNREALIIGAKAAHEIRAKADIDEAVTETDEELIEEDALKEVAADLAAINELVAAFAARLDELTKDSDTDNSVEDDGDELSEDTDEQSAGGSGKALSVNARVQAAKIKALFAAGNGDK